VLPAENAEKGKRWELLGKVKKKGQEAIGACVNLHFGVWKIVHFVAEPTVKFQVGGPAQPCKDVRRGRSDEKRKKY